MNAYYNENNKFAAAWLRNLIADGHIASGDVDERSIVEVSGTDLKGYTQAHFFAGIAGWSYALRLAGWPDDRPIWTGSCPCQPFSAAGKRKGFTDERHLWPVWFKLIKKYKPPIILGEQVAAAIGGGWLDVVFSDLEAEGYTCGAAVLPACSVGAPHIRQRLWWVADTNGGHASTEGLQRGWEQRQFAQDGGTGELADAAGSRCGAGRAGEAGDHGAARLEPSGLRADGLGYASDGGLHRVARRRARQITEDRHAWSDLIWLPCSDGKARPTQPGIFPLAHGVSARVGKLRAAGNAIVPQVAAEFIKAIMAS